MADRLISTHLVLAYRTWAASCLLVMVVMIAFSPNELKYDERYHIGLASSIRETGWINGLTSPKNQSAAGPLFPAIHNAMYFATLFQAPHIRWINFGILIGFLVVVYKTISDTNPFAEQITLSLLGIPFIWPSTVMALTELPALFAFNLSIYCLFSRFRHTCSTDGRFLLPIIGGLWLGLAILGRQTFLIVFPAFGIIALCYRDRMYELLIFILTAAITCSWVFVIWRGLVPESQLHTGNGISMQYGLKGLSYVAVASFILNPNQFLGLSKRDVFSSLLLSLTCAVSTASPDSVPFGTLFNGYLTLGNQQILSVLLWSVIFQFGILWVMLLVRNLMIHRYDSCRTLNALLVFSLAIAPFKVTHGFSSRYVVGTVGAEAIRAESFRPSFMHIAVLLITSTAGIWSAFSYLYR